MANLCVERSTPEGVTFALYERQLFVVDGLRACAMLARPIFSLSAYRFLQGNHPLSGAGTTLEVDAAAYVLYALAGRTVVLIV
jgi:hypothetical protein